MKPRLFLLLLLLIVPPPTRPSPVTYITQNNSIEPVKIISTAIIATEKVIITTKYPVSKYVLHELCVKTYLELMKDTCITPKTIHTTFSDLALMELKQDLRFGCGVNAAEVPFVDSMKRLFDFTTNCRMVVNVRQFDGMLQKSIEAVISSNDDLPLINVTLKEEHGFCIEDNGLPLYCRDAVVGILVYKEEANCLLKTEVQAAKLISKETKAFLRRFIPTPLK